MKHDAPAPPGLHLQGLPLLRAIRRDPLGTAQVLQARFGDIAKLKVLSTRLYYLFHPADIRQALVEHHHDFAKDERLLAIFRPVHGINVLTTEGPAWERQRRMLAPAFTPKRVAACASLMRAAVGRGIRDELPVRPGDGAVIDVDRLTTSITMDVILHALFGYQPPREQADALSQAVRALTHQMMREFFWPLRPAAWMPWPGKASKRRNLATVRGFIQSRIDERRRTGSGDSADILGLLLDAHDDNETRLTPQELLDNCVGLFGAGHDTSASALTWWIGLMAKHPEVAGRVREEVRASDPATHDPAALRLLHATLKEAMRLYPPSTAMFSRRALRAVRIGDHELPRGSLVVIPIWSLHHDPRWFREPESFHPERFLPGAPEIPRSAFMPFGVGPHFCLGQQFAMLEMAIIAAALIRDHDLALQPDSSLPEPEVDVVLKPRERLLVRFTRRSGQEHRPQAGSYSQPL